MAHKTNSSVKAYSGSAKGAASHVSAASHVHAHNHNGSSSKKHSGTENLDRYVQDERDHRSLAVAEYDAHQQEAKERHVEQLNDVVNQNY
ncbi:hypothetical protein LZ554_004231 [Drepanopeziza brunnea f. sp. 'monogermtubi']|nr:hypothetical protein LZ554_004231 [Drepanopeziza brunnea f. sp. 'monogermtubi']